MTTGVVNTALVGMAGLLWVKNSIYGNLNFTASHLSLWRSSGSDGTSAHAEIHADIFLCRPDRLKQAHVHLGVHPL